VSAATTTGCWSHGTCLPSVVIDVGLSLADAEPPDGHVDPIPIEGRLRD
jgi:hypothetical protein